jgi:hypothetical protein
MDISYGKPKPQRLAEIADFQNTPSRMTESFRIDDDNSRAYSQYTVSIDMPMYRIENTRTVFAQEMAVLREEVQENTFSDPESKSAQKYQHKILEGMLDEKNLYDTFKRGVEQQHPLMLSNDGFVIVGNRRLACWRKLFHQDPQVYSHFEEIRVCIFENKADSREAEKFEALQETDEDIQSKFDWIAVAKRFSNTKDQYAKQGYPERGYDAIIHDYKNSDYLKFKRRDKNIDEINILVKAYENAIDIIKKGNLTEIEVVGQKQLFTDWAKNNHHTTTERSTDDRKIYDLVSESYALKHDELGTRAYTPINDANKHFDEFLKNFASENKIKDNSNRSKNVLKTLKKMAIDDRVEKCKYIVENIKERKKWEGKKTATLNLLSEANAKTVNALNSITDHTDPDGCINQINLIRETLQMIEELLQEEN